MLVEVKVVPNSRRIGVSREGDVLVVRVRSPPKGGKANKEVIEVLADWFGVSRSEVRIVRGLRSKIKTVEVNTSG